MGVDSRQDSVNMGRVALKVFFALANEWKSTDEELCKLLNINSVEVIGSWRALEQNNQGALLAKDVEENISHLIAIYRLTQAIFPGKESSWIRRSNQYFNDRSPYEIMLNGKTGVETVRSYLEALSQDNYM